ncbi:protein gvpF [Salinigranum rubrum]|uniref:Protein gvpF n=1 Tax=Salinigranum rubrum TaxID=755307 RepID=A0A2I8VKJ5_9EURY|nr:GvpL/GvpF family gas vesicle protein [Salinigranum rubrum]AUV82452.1 protein gvpF [Salinigranum rubrum]
MSKVYVYGVTDAAPFTASLDGVEDATEVRTVEHDPLAAVVSDVEEREPPRTDENVQAHDEVLRSVMTGGDGRTVVPMQFGMVFEGEGPLRNVLRSGRPTFTRSLNEVDGTFEFGVKVVAPDDGGVPPAVTESVSEELASASVAEADGDQFSDRLVLNRSYLVERAEREAFDDAIDRVRERHDSLTVRYTGPYAPYNFVDIHIGAER